MPLSSCILAAVEAAVDGAAKIVEGRETALEESRAIYEDLREKQAES